MTNTLFIDAACVHVMLTNNMYIKSIMETLCYRTVHTVHYSIYSLFIFPSRSEGGLLQNHNTINQNNNCNTQQFDYPLITELPFTILELAFPKYANYLYACVETHWLANAIELRTRHTHKRVCVMPPFRHVQKGEMFSYFS